MLKNKNFYVIYFIVMIVSAFLFYSVSFAQTTRDIPQNDAPEAPSPDPLDMPVMNDSDLSLWTATVIPEIFTLDHKNYASVLENDKAYFTSNGFSQFSAMLQKTNFLDGIIKNREALSIGSTGLPRICRQERSGGAYIWFVETPKLFTFQKESGEQSVVPFYVHMKIVRSEEPQNVKKVGVDTLTVMPATDTYIACDYEKKSFMNSLLDTLPKDTKLAMEVILKLEDENKALKTQLQSLQQGKTR